jgi:hypothetical protein
MPFVRCVNCQVVFLNVGLYLHPTHFCSTQVTSATGVSGVERAVAPVASPSSGATVIPFSRSK